MDNGTIALLIPILGILMLMIPVAGFTARFALKPIVEAIARFREMQGGSSAGEIRVLEQRVALLEQQLQGVEGSLQHLQEVKRFERELASPER